jgi:two-component system CheB/CheR fusion protein
MVVGIGASAGGIQALQRFFAALPAHPGMVFGVVMHLSPEHESNLAQVLQSYTAMPVSQVTGRVHMDLDHVYVIPPNQDLRITDGHLIVSDFEQSRGRRAPVDVFFRTLAEMHPDGIGILLSGGGTDGTMGLKAIKEHGGLVMVQSPEEAEIEAMPRSAIATGLVDFILPAAKLAEKLLELRQYGLTAGLQMHPEALGESEEDALQMILRLLQARTGHDFSGYKPATVLRRLERRLRVVQVDSLAAYLGYLRGHPPEAQALLKDLLISVTTFFRDSEAFEALREEVIPRLFEGKGQGDEVRVWVPGCATGEEAYSIAILLLEQVEALKTAFSIQLFASDLDEDALAYGREGRYPETIVADVSEARLQRFFVREGAYYRVKKELREIILFAPHNLLKDPPFSRLDLISCRNLLIYLQRNLQERVAELFHYALKPEGYLFLGNAESLEGVSRLFRAVDNTQRIYRRDLLPAHGSAHLPELPLAGTMHARLALFGLRPVSPPQTVSDAELHRQALEAHAPPSLLVDAEANIVHVSETANRYLQFPSGSPSLSLYRAALPELRLELKTALYRALERDEATFSAPVPVEIRGQHCLVQLFVTPTKRDQTPALALVVFIEANPPEPGTRSPEAYASGDDDAQLRQMEQGIETVKAQLHATIESAEIQHEELKAANEELQSINEEYRSTLEELETSKEELQSINEELQTVNHELQERLKEINQANNDFQNLIAATEVATLFVDRQLRIKLYTPPLTQLFNIMPVDQGRPLAHVTHRLSDGDILGDIQQVLGTLVPIERQMQRNDGRYYLMRLMPYRTSDDRIDGVILTFVDITARQREEEVRQALTEQLERELADTQQLQQISTLMIQEGNTDALYQQILDAAIALMRSDMGGIHMFDADCNELRLLVWKGFHPESAAFWEGVHLDSDSCCGAALRTGQRVIVPEIEACESLVGTPELEGYRRSDIHAVQATPLISRAGRMLGMISTHWHRPYQPSERDLRLLDVLARQAADFIERSQTEVVLQRANAELERRVTERTATLGQQTQQLQHEMAERQRMQEVLFQREKLAALGMLLANVAHELNNPLAVAAWQLDHLQEEGGSDSWTEDIDLLRQAVERCQSVVESFLSLARQPEPTRRAVMLNAVTGDVLVLLAHALEADGIIVERHLAEDLPLLWADPHQLHHLIANLITNAQQALRQTAPPRHLKLTTTANADRSQVILDVSDSGPGIPEEVQRHIFEPFFTTKPQGMGSGLGLPLCRSIVQGHGGTIHLTSEPGHGTTVYVTLPVTAPEVQLPEAAPEPVEPVRASGTSILLIDDEPNVQRSLRRVLQRSGYEVTTAGTGQEGLVALEERSYAVILCDMRMPDLDGAGFYRELERRYPQLLPCLIFLTGDVLSPETQGFLAQVDNLRLKKPCRAQEVRRAIEQVLASQGTDVS